MLPDEIQDEEILYRAVNSNPNFVKEKNGERRVTSAVFKDSTGASVDREGEREEIEIAKIFLNRPKHEEDGLVKISAEECREHNAEPESDPIQGNPYHGIIKRDNGQLQLSQGQAKRLSRNCEVIYYPGESVGYLED